MSDEIVLEGNTYVSSKRAAEMSSYAQDYIGQLARKGLIEARRVGGLWYVVMSSLENYKIASATGEIKEVKQVSGIGKDSETSIEFEGNTYISANRASELTGYNQDYVGQLARSGKIPSRQVGNRWYIDPDAIVQHKKEKDELLAQVQADSVGVSRNLSSNPLNTTKTVNQDNLELMSYKSTEGDLIPQIKEREYIDIRIEKEHDPIKITRIQPRKSLESNQLNIRGNREEESSIGKARYGNRAIKDKNRSKDTIFVAVGALIVISILVSVFKFTPVTSIVENLPGISSISGLQIQDGVLSRILGSIEQLISPELVYVRQ